MGADHLSIWGLLIEADPIVKVVILILVVASFWSWAIIIDKLLRFRRLRDMAIDQPCSDASKSEISDFDAKMFR